MKPIRISSKTAAEEISLTLINDKAITDAENFIHHLGHMTKLKKREMVKIIKIVSRKSNDLMEKLLKIQESDEETITEVINEHWREFWDETESIRYSEYSAIAYKRLKNILKYHLFEKRDGGIINCIKNEDGTVELQPEKINDLLLKTMEEIQVDNKWNGLNKKSSHISLNWKKMSLNLLCINSLLQKPSLMTVYLTLCSQLKRNMTLIMTPRRRKPTSRNLQRNY